MDELTVDSDFDDEVRQVMRDRGIEREDAIYLVALRRGQVYGAGDLVCMHPLTPEERRRIGLDHDPEQIIAEDRARLAEEAASKQPDSVVDGADSPVASSGVRRR